MSNNILVYIDQYQGTALPASWEALGAGRMLAKLYGGANLVVLVAGERSKDVAGQAFQYGAEKALFADDATLADYRAEAYAAVLVKVARELAPLAVLLPTTFRGRELAAMSAIDLDSGILADVSALELQDGKVLATRQVYAGKALSKVVCDALPQIITTRGRAFEKPAADPARSGAPTQVPAVLAEADIPTKILSHAAAEGGVSLGDAAVIVSGGRGVANNPTCLRRQGWTISKPRSGALSKALSCWVIWQVYWVVPWAPAVRPWMQATSPTSTRSGKPVKWSALTCILLVASPEPSSIRPVCAAAKSSWRSTKTPKRQSLSWPVLVWSAIYTRLSRL